ncbi:MAG TPA: PA14 domain-containing protein [Verrucomicrobiota bacterium]|nr:PA14 domain-containing protein [Verrucomicrobiota bacterium]
MRSTLLKATLAVLLLAGGNISETRAGAVIRYLYMGADPLTGIPGASVADLRADPTFPQAPTGFELDSLYIEGRVNVGEYYGSMTAGFIEPPETGQYTFYVATDDAGELWLSTDADPAHKVLLCQVSGWTLPRGWYKAGEQQSAPVTLVKGSKYYLEILMKEEVYGDHVSAAWIRPGGRFECPIPALYAQPYSLTSTATTPVIEVQPADSVTTENLEVTFSVTMAPAAVPFSYQWYADDVPIPDATSSAYSFKPTVADHGRKFHVRVNDALSSTQATLTVTPAADAPVLLAADTLGYDRFLQLTFDKIMDPITTGMAANYTIDSGTVAVHSAALQPDGVTVYLRTAAFDQNSTHTLVVNGVGDNAAPAHVVHNASVRFGAVPGRATLRYYLDIGGGKAVQDLLNSPKYPDSPDQVVYAALAEGWLDWADNYGAMMEGWFLPPSTADYTFAIASDDNSALYLSADATVENLGATPIAAVATWCYPRQYETEPGQQSSPIPLLAHRPYYFRALMKEEAYGANLSVAMSAGGASIPNDAPSIPGEHLIPVIDPAVPLSITAEPEPVHVRVNMAATFAVSVAGRPGWTSAQWYRNGLPIDGANALSYTLPHVALENDQDTFKVVVSNLVDTVISEEVTLTVTDDTTPPSMVAVRGRPYFNRITVGFSEPIDPASVLVKNFTVLMDPGVPGGQVVGAVVVGETNVVLTLENRLVPRTYTINIDNVADMSGNVIAAGTTGVMEMLHITGYGHIEYFDNYYGDLDALPGYIDSRWVPDRTLAVNSAATPTWENGDHYGSRFEGWLSPEKTGYYTFYICSDDASRFYLSADEYPENIGSNPICWVNGWTDPREWNKELNQGSELQHLEAYRLYYFCAYQAEGEFGDGVGIGWVTPSDFDGVLLDGEPEIPGMYLYTVCNPENSTVLITQQPTSVSAFAGDTVTFSIAATGSSDIGDTVFYQWYAFSDTLNLIPGATGPTLTLDNVSANDEGLYLCLVTMPGNGVWSDQVNLELMWQVRAAGSLMNHDAVELGVAFGVPVDPVYTTNTGCYTLSKGSVDAVRLQGYSGGIDPGQPPNNLEGMSVVLEVSGVDIGDRVTLTVDGVCAWDSSWIEPASLEIEVSGKMKFAAVGGDEYVEEGGDPIKWPDDAIGCGGDSDFDLISSGSANWNAYDELTFVYEEVEGDFDKVVRIAYQDPTSHWARAGLCARAALDEGVTRTEAESQTVKMSKGFLVNANPVLQWDGASANNRYEVHWRLTDGGNYGYYSDGTPSYPNAWVRMARTNQTFYAYKSSDGVNWTLLCTQAFDPAVEAMPERIYVGMYYCPQLNDSWAGEGIMHSTVARFRSYGDYKLPVSDPPPATVTVDDDYSAAGCGWYTWHYDAFDSIQDGVDAVADGGTVNVLEGSYSENVVVARPLLLALGSSPAEVTVLGDLTLGSGVTVAMELDGLAPGTGHDQWVVQGAVDLADATLSLTKNTTLGPGDSVTLIDKGGTEAVTGTFHGLPEGAAFTLGGQVFSVSYQGGTGNDVVLTTSANQPPTANPNAGATRQNSALTIAAVKLSGNDADPDHDPLSVVGVSAASVQGGTVALDAGQVTYTPATDFTGSDSYTYTVSDGRGGTAVGTVHVEVIPSSGQGQNVWGVRLENGTCTIVFAGIPGVTYAIEASADLDSWVKLGEAPAGANGLFEWLDPDASSVPIRFYRSCQP